MSDNTAYLIVGIDRSGTSVTARVLNRLGPQVHNPGGEGHRHPAWNPTGYYEDTAVNKELDRGRVDLICDLARRYKDKKAWALKDPRLAWPDNLRKAVHAIRETTPDLRLVVTSRPIEDITASRQRCGGEGNEQYIRDLHDKMWTAVLATNLPHHVVDYNALIDTPHTEVARLAEFVGLTPTTFGAVLKLRAARDAIDPKQRHFNV